MYNITGFNRAKFHKVVIISTFFATLIITAFHQLLSIEFGTVISALVIFTVFLLNHLYVKTIIEKKFAKHENIVKQVLNAISDVIVIKDYQGNFLFCNETVAKLYNSDPEAMVGKDDYYFTKNREQADFFRENIQGIMDRQEIEEVYESSTDAKTGEIRHFLSLKIPFIDARENRKIVVMAKDVTEITRLKEEADRNKRRLEHVLDVSEEGLWEWNTQTNQVLHNERWEQITGIERSDNSFKEFESCILPEDREKVGTALQALIERNEPYSVEFRMKRPDGEVIWIWDRGQVAEFDDDGKPVWLAGIALDITTEKLNQQKIRHLAYYDQLTDLPNRALLELELEETIRESAQRGCYSSVLFLDLDRFKLLNDAYGHHMGDILLKMVADRMKNISPEQGIISRFGGDEFVVVLPLLDKDQVIAAGKAQRYAEDLAREISHPLQLKSDLKKLEIEYAITTSIGGVVFKSDEISSGKLLQFADLALYRVKANGGNSAMIFDTKMQDELQRTSGLQKAMRDSIVNNDFCIYLQPKYNIQERITGAEALVRWNHPELGVVSPALFIDMAEESNLIIPIGENVLDQACQQLEQWQSDPATAHLEISVNLSAKQIWQNHFVEDFISIIEQHDIDHSKLIIEVTESVVIQDINDATEKLSRLKAYGLSISLDDFGTGYSSLSYLRSLPIDEIKIDRSFIKDVTQDKQAYLMVKSIIDLANNFNLNVVSEGVEEREQLELLKDNGISNYQGFYFSKPLPQDDFARLVHTSQTDQETSLGAEYSI